MKSVLSILFILLVWQISFAQTESAEYGGVIPDEEYAYLSIFADKLNKNADTKGIIIIHKHKTEPVGHFLRHFYGVRNYLINQFSAPAERFSVLYGGEVEGRRTEMRIIKGESEKSNFPKEALDETLSGKIRQKTLFDEECIDCDPVVFINESIFIEGLDYFARALKENPNTNALIEISKVEYVSKTRKEKKELTNKIFEVLVKDNKISRDRIKIKFKSGMTASFYIIPKIDKNNKK
jgi:hypothetical protein